MPTKPNLTITPRHASDRGVTRLPSLHSRHTFSFGNYIDPDQVGYRSLRVINEDRLAPGKSSPEHHHYSMEILSLVISGTLNYSDDRGNAGRLKAGDFQLMTTGRGISHRESNPSADIPAHFIQIWIQPNQSGGDPRYVEFNIETRKIRNGLTVLASPDGQFDSAQIHQEAKVLFGDLNEGATVEVSPESSYPHTWIQILQGEVKIESTHLAAGDGVQIEASNFFIEGTKDADFLLIRLC